MRNKNMLKRFFGVVFLTAIPLSASSIINETGTVNNLGGITCMPCFDDVGNKYVKGASLTVGQGSSVLTCFEAKLDGVCVLKVIRLDLIVERKDYYGSYYQYCIISEDPTVGCLSKIGSPNPYYSPNIAGYDSNDATVNYLVPAWEISELAPGDQVLAHYEGAVQIGLGYCCADPVPDDCGYNNIFARVGSTDFVGQNFTITIAPKEEDNTDDFLMWILLIALRVLLSLMKYFATQT